MFPSALAELSVNLMSFTYVPWEVSFENEKVLVSSPKHPLNSFPFGIFGA